MRLDFINNVPTTGIADIGGHLLFFMVLYIISLIKLTIGFNPAHNFLFNIYSVLIAIYILSRFLLAYFHKTMPLKTGYEPTITLVVPAKDEEDNIAETIRCFVRTDYPREKMEVIAINDGSTDRTLDEMLMVEKELIALGISVEIVNNKINKGKREGMAEGVKRAKNEIVIFVDSDSFIHPDCVRNLVKYFHDPRVGAVSGHTDVHNIQTNMLTRMQALRYYVAFRVYKAAESIFGMVTCCPGCCSAYRKEYVNPVLDAWLKQKFLGTVCTFGDDRSLTNFIIRKYDAVYSPDALAATVVPDTLKKYVKQQQRWKKSWIRETFIASTFMWKKNPIAALSFYSYMFLAFGAPIVFIRAAVYYPLFVTHAWPMTYLLGLGLMLALHGIYYRNHVKYDTNVKKTSWLLPVVSFWFYTILLIWQLPWAFVTIRDMRWGTR